MNSGAGHDDFDVVPSLIDLLAGAMTKVEEQRGVKPAHKAIGSHVGVSHRQIRRYLRDRTSSPPAGELDALVTAVAAESGQQRMDFWRQAVATVEHAVDARGGDPRQEAAEAAALAPIEEPDSDDSR